MQFLQSEQMLCGFNCHSLVTDTRLWYLFKAAGSSLDQLKVPSVILMLSGAEGKKQKGTTVVSVLDIKTTTDAAAYV